jgi:hypothetical protein
VDLTLTLGGAFREAPIHSRHRMPSRQLSVLFLDR